MAQALVSMSSDRTESSMPVVKVPEPGECMVESHPGDDPGRCAQVLAESCAGIGILVLSSTCKTLYANQAAYEFLKVLNRWEHGHATDGALPGAIAGLYDQMDLVLAGRNMQGDGEKLKAQRLLTGEGRTVRLNVFGLRDRLGVREPRVVIMMQRLTDPLVS